MEELNLGVNRISDISPLRHLSSLTDLAIWHNQISDISPLAHLKELTKLNCEYNQITDYRPLFDLDLKKLHIEYAKDRANGDEELAELAKHLPDCEIIN